jgi:hypothetical protein
MSAVAPIATELLREGNGRKGPEPTSAVSSYTAKTINFAGACALSSVALLVLVDPHAIRHIRWGAENNVIPRLQSRANVDAGAIV